MATLDVLTLTEAKQTLSLTGTTAFDAELAGWITAVSQRLDRLVGPIVVRTVTDEAHDGGHHEVFLEYYPVSVVTSVVEYDGTTATTLTAETNEVKPADGYLSERYKPNPVLQSKRIRRRSTGTDDAFPVGRLNVVVSYSAGRFADTASVEDRYKTAAKFMLQNFWRSRQDSVRGQDEFDVPMASFPGFAIPRAVRELFPDEVQEPRVMVA